MAASVWAELSGAAGSGAAAAPAPAPEAAAAELPAGTIEDGITVEGRLEASAFATFPVLVIELIPLEKLAATLEKLLTALLAA